MRVAQDDLVPDESGRSAGGVFFPGPTTLEGLFNWPNFAVRRMLDYAATNGIPQFGVSLRRVARNIQVSTSYSGMGCAEAVCPMLKAALRTVGVETSFQIHSATDTNSTCRRVLLQHQEDSRPEHVFFDVLDRLPPAVRVELEAAGKELRELLQERVEKFKREAARTAEEVRKFEKPIVEELGQLHLRRLRDTLAAVDFLSPTTCPCAAHERQCSVSVPARSVIPSGDGRGAPPTRDGGGAPPRDGGGAPPKRPPPPTPSITSCALDGGGWHDLRRLEFHGLQATLASSQRVAVFDMGVLGAGPTARYGGA